MRPAAIAFATAGFLASIAAAIVVADFAVTKLEDATMRNSKSALVASGQSWANIATDGTLVYLSGTAPDERGRMQALDSIGDIVSSRRLKDTTEVEESIPAVAPDFALEILRSGTDISLIGITPAEVDTDIVRSAIAELQGISLIDMKESTNWSAPDGWAEALSFGSEIMTKLDRAKISIQPGRVNVTAVVKSAEEKVAVQQELNAIRPSAIDFSIDITAPRPIFSPYKLSLSLAGADSEFMCYALTQEGAARILAAVDSLDISGTSPCEIGLGAPTEDWSDVAISGISAIATIGAGSLTIQDSSVTLTAPKGFDPETFAIISTTLRNALPDAYALAAILPEDDVANDDNSRPYFRAALDENGSATLTGVTIDDISKRTLFTYAQAKFGSGTVSDLTKIANFAPHGWTSRQLVALEVLGLLTKGNINVTEDAVSVTGTGEVAGLYDTILAKLEAGFGADAHFNIVVEEIIPEPEIEDLPDAQICETEISALLAENQILFAPSSAVIESLSVKTINKIVAILNRCRHAAFEIGGHTDSQGREEMNKNLSQSRADAVLDSLLSRNMLLGELTAVGYGEAQPIADNETEEGRQENRRIAFKLIEEATNGQN